MSTAVSSCRYRSRRSDEDRKQRPARLDREKPHGIIGTPANYSLKNRSDYQRQCQLWKVNGVLSSKVGTCCGTFRENTSMSEIASVPNGYMLYRATGGDREPHRPVPDLGCPGVSRELVLLYWSVGAEILLRQKAQGWGSKVIDRLGRDLQARFPGVEGFSPRNLKYMRSLAEAWPDSAIVPQRVALLPWGHVRLLLDRVKDPVARDWYLGAAVREGWNREGSRPHDRRPTLCMRREVAEQLRPNAAPPEQSEMAVQVLRDPCNFDFLTRAHPLEERKLERGLQVGGGGLSAGTDKPGHGCSALDSARMR